MSPWCYVHFTTLGLRLQPPCADAMGYIPYRSGVVSRLKRGDEEAHATSGERFIAECESWIERWQTASRP